MSSQNRKSDVNSSIKELQIPSSSSAAPVAAVRIKVEESDAPMKQQQQQQSVSGLPIKEEPSAATALAVEASAAVVPRAFEAFSSPVSATEASRAAVAGNAEDPPSLKSMADANAEDPPILKSMADIRSLSEALAIFTFQFDELRKHLDSIKESIAKRSKELDADESEETANVEPELPIKGPTGPDNSSAPGNTNQPRQTERVESLAHGSTNQRCTNKPAELSPGSPDEPRPHLEVVCQTMNGRGLRKYVASQLPKIQKLRKEITDMLKRVAPNPARLTLDSLCGFFLQGNKVFAVNPRMVLLRRAAIRILEFFILAGCPKVEAPVKVEAETSASLWKKRLVREGGIVSACYEDAIGLLLLVAAFGLASAFETNDLYEVVKLSKIWKKAGALRRAPEILELIQDIIQRLVKNGMHVEAVGLVCNFDMKDKLPPESLLSDFLRETYETPKKMRKEGHDSPEALKEASKKKLSALKSVVKCVEEFRLNSDELADWKITEKIMALENDITDITLEAEEKTAQKRKAEELGSSENAKHEAKRRQPNSATSLPGPSTPAVVSSLEQTFYDAPPHSKIFVHPKFPGLINGYSSSPVKPAGLLSDESGMGMVAANIPVSLARIGSGSAAGAGPSVGNGGLPSTGSENAKHEAKRGQPNSATPLPGPSTPAVVSTLEQMFYDAPLHSKIFVHPKFPGLINGYSGSPVKPAGLLSNESGMELVAANIPVSLARIGSGSAAGAGPSAGNGGLPTTGSENAKHEAKRGQPNSATPLPGPSTPAVVSSLEQTLYDALLHSKIFVHPKFPGLINGYSSSPAKPAGLLSDESGMGPVAANIPGTLERIGSGSAAGAGPSSAGNGGLPSTGSGVSPYVITGSSPSSGNSGRPLTDNGIGPSGWHREEVFNSPSVGQSFLGSFPPSAFGQSLAEPSTSTVPALFGLSYRDPGPDLYRFADTVLEGMSHFGSGSHVDNVTTVTARAQASVYRHHSHY